MDSDELREGYAAKISPGLDDTQIPYEYTHIEEEEMGTVARAVQFYTY
jgi:hypothetical protein